MFNKIEKQIDEFTKDIKEAKGCDEMLIYLNSNYVSSIKLLMFASSTFSLYGRLMLFLVMASAALLLSSIIGAMPLSITLFLGTTIFSFILILLYVTHCRNLLSESIKKAKSMMQEAKENKVDAK